MRQLTIRTADTRTFEILFHKEKNDAFVEAILRKRDGWWMLGKPFKQTTAIGPTESLHWTEALKRALALLEEPT